MSDVARYGWLLALGGWNTFWAIRLFDEGSWVAAWIFTAGAVTAFAAIMIVDYRDQRKARKPKTPS